MKFGHAVVAAIAALSNSAVSASLRKEDLADRVDAMERDFKDMKVVNLQMKEELKDVKAENLKMKNELEDYKNERRLNDETLTETIEHIVDDRFVQDAEVIMERIGERVDHDVAAKMAEAVPPAEVQMQVMDEINGLTELGGGDRKLTLSGGDWCMHFFLRGEFATWHNMHSKEHPWFIQTTSHWSCDLCPHGGSGMAMAQLNENYENNLDYPPESATTSFLTSGETHAIVFFWGKCIRYD